MTRVLAVDPGLTRCGVAVVDGRGRRGLAMQHADVVRTDPSARLGERLLDLERELTMLADRWAPEVVVVERVFSRHNVASAMSTAQAAAVALLIAARRGVESAEHTPTEVKAAVTGDGQAGKQQVAAMVTRLLGLSVAPKPVDATDALALAICHLWRMPMLERLSKLEVLR